MRFYERFEELCREKGVKPTPATLEAGCSRGSASYWKKKYLEGEDALPDTRNAQALADYFGVSVDYLLGGAEDDAAGTPSPPCVQSAEDEKKERFCPGSPDRFSPQDAELIFALWGDADNIDEKDLEDVKRFAAFIKERKRGQ